MKNKYGNKRGKKLIFVDDSIAYLDYPRKCTENLSKNLQSSGQLKNNLKKKLFNILLVTNLKILINLRGDQSCTPPLKKPTKSRKKCPPEAYHFDLRIPRIKQKRF